MPQFNFYRQKRIDGGVRTGLTLDDELVWHSFEEGGRDEDPALRWFVDLRGEGEGVPDDPDELKNWLLQHSSLIRNAFVDVSKRFLSGADFDAWPVRTEVASIAPDIRLEIVLSAIRRQDLLEIGDILRDIGDSFAEIIAHMRCMVAES